MLTTAGTSRRHLANGSLLPNKAILPPNTIWGLCTTRARGVPQDYGAGVKWYTRAAEQEHIDAQFRLGVMYWSGIDVLQGYEAALKWYTLAAKQGDSNAQNNLGVMFANGQGVPEDFIYAHMWFSVSALNGNANGRKSREIIEKRMIAAQIGIAEELAQKCARNQYKDC